MGNQRLELPTQRIALDPVDHEPTKTGSSCHTFFSIDVRDVVTDIFPAFHKVNVWGSAWSVNVSILASFYTSHVMTGLTPVILNSICQVLPKSDTSCRIRCNDDVALVSEDLGVPPATPAIAPGALWTTVNVEAERIGLGLVESLRIDNPGLNLTVVSWFYFRP